MTIALHQNQLEQDEYYAAVDLGSNSFHMVIVRRLGGSVQIVSTTKEKVRVAEGLDENNFLSQEAISRALNCLHKLKEKLSNIPQSNIMVVATATFRLAKNADVFKLAAEEILNTPVNIISGEEEAKQIYLGVAYTSAHQGNTLVIDIGGASTEVIVGRDMRPIYLKSFNMGCVTYMEKYFGGGHLSTENFKRAEQAASQQLNEFADTFLCFDWQQCLGASGTPQAITNILVNQNISDAIKLHYLEKLKHQCIECEHISRLSIRGLDESRRIIFPSGLAILISLFKKLNIQDMQIAGGALREGIIYGMLDNYQQTNRRNHGLEQLIERFHIDAKQSQRVSQTAKTLLEQLYHQVQFCDFDSEVILYAAATLHEIGLHIDYKAYNEHGAYVLEHTQLTGYTQLQKHLIRDTVKLHRLTIDTNVLSKYQDEMRELLINCVRLVRIAVILCTRRSCDHIVIPTLQVCENDEWRLHFEEQPLSSLPIVQAELIQESWLQHKAGWRLSCE